MSVIANISAPKFRTTSRLVQWVRRNRPIGRLPVESERCFFRSKEAPARISQNLLLYANMVGPLGDELEAIIPDEEIHKYIAKIAQRGVKAKESLLGRVSDPMRLARLASSVGRLPERFEDLLVEPACVFAYAETLGLLSESLEMRLVGSPVHVAQYLWIVDNQGKEMPEHLLRALVGHDQYFMDLARRMKSLPKYLEDSIRTPIVALNYAIHVLKGRLPSHLEDVLAGDTECMVRYAFDVIRAHSSPRLPDNLHAAVMLSPSGGDSVVRYLSEVARTSKEPAPAGV